MHPPLGVTVNCYQNMGFADSTLLMAFSLCDSGSSGSSQTQLIASVGKGSFKRLDTDGKVSSITLIVSQDAGATWKTVTLADNGSSVHLFAIDPLDHYWVGVFQNAPMQLAISSDGGQIWQKLPPPWANEMGPDFLFVAPDGTVLVTDARAKYTNCTSSTFTLYEAPPGAVHTGAAWLSSDS
jgi:hypothetical protein